MQLNQQRKSLTAIRGRMERDYNMISSRYMKLFNGLNANLKQRIFELDRPTIDYAVKEVERISNRTKYLAATVPVGQLESLATSQKIIASNVKYRGMNVIHSMKKFLGDMSEQKKLTNRIILDNYRAVDASFSLPVIICEMNHDKFGNKTVDVVVNNTGLSNATQSAIKNAVMPDVDHLGWKTGETDENVKSEFYKLLSDSNTSQRVKDRVSKLFSANSYQIIQNQPV